MTPQTVLFFLLLDLLLKGAAVLILATVAAWLLRHASAANRNAIWSSAFLVLLLLPATLALQPQWSWISPRAVVSRELAPPDAVTARSPAHSLSVADATSSRALMGRLLEWQSALVATWLAGAFLLLARRAAGTLQLCNLRRRSIAPPSRILQLSREAADACQLRRGVEVRLSEDRTVPLTWGIWKPVILLPVESVEWHEDLLRIVFQHEYGHIRRHDACFRLLVQIACAIHWMNPLAWHAGRKLRLVQEQAVDDFVLRGGVDSVAYADALVASVRHFLQPARTFEDALAMAQPSTLETRVNALLDKRRDRRPLNRPFLIVSGIISALMVAGSAVAQISAKQSDSTSERPAAESSAPRTAQPPRVDATAAQAVPAPASSPATAAAVPRDDFGKHPIEINAENTSFENGVAFAVGKATLSYLGVKIAADTIRYFPATRMVIAQGNLNYTVENGNRITGADAVLEYNLETQKAKVSGKHQTVLKKQ